MLKLIKTEAQYEETLERVYELMQMKIEPDSTESDELELLTLIVQQYELEHFPIPKPHPLEAIKFRMEQMNLSEADLSEILGHRSRKSEILSGKRKLSLNMIRRLKEKLKIPADVLIAPY
jgi:HTH-type transcriptional regulator / antitoxin HigA